MKDLFPIMIISRSFAEAVVPRLKLEHGDGISGRRFSSTIHFRNVCRPNGAILFKIAHLQKRQR
jgi:hypothetical protein